VSKQAEREYALRVDPDHLYHKPFNDPRVLRELATVIELFQSITPRGRILDLGCGSGWTSLFLARAGFQVVGVDISERMIEIARERSQRENCPVSFIAADMEEMCLDTDHFDGALFFDCLHHCNGYLEALRRSFAHLRPGGYVLLFETTWLHRFSPRAREASRRYGVTELGFSRRQLRRALASTGFCNLRHFHDPGPAYGGFARFLWTNLRLWCDYLTAFPQAKNIIVAQKPADE
jgi:SAM-dependent methyltransferase